MPFKRITYTQFLMWLMGIIGMAIWILAIETNITHYSIEHFLPSIFTSMIIYKIIIDLGLHIREHRINKSLPNFMLDN